MWLGGWVGVVKGWGALGNLGPWTHVAPRLLTGPGVLGGGFGEWV